MRWEQESGEGLGESLLTALRDYKEKKHELGQKHKTLWAGFNKVYSKTGLCINHFSAKVRAIDCHDLEQAKQNLKALYRSNKKLRPSEAHVLYIVTKHRMLEEHKALEDQYPMLPREILPALCQLDDAGFLTEQALCSIINSGSKSAATSERDL